MNENTFASILTRLGTWTARPEALLVVLLFAILWLIFERETLDWHGAATLATWIMTFFIQRSTYRDTQAIQAKLDELLRAEEKASNRFTRLDEQEPEAIEALREGAQARDRPST